MPEVCPPDALLLFSSAQSAAALQDWSEAVSLYQQAAKIGLTSSQHALATPWLERFFETDEQSLSGSREYPGDLGSDDDPEVFSYRIASHLATKAIIATVARELADRYDSGFAVVADPRRAEYWRAKAAQYSSDDESAASGAPLVEESCVAPFCVKPVQRRAVFLMDGLCQVEHYCAQHFTVITEGIDVRKLSNNDFLRLRDYRLAELCTEVGKRHLTGHGVQQDATEAIRWLERAGELRSVDAHILLFFAFANGVAGIAVDKERAIAESWRALMVSLHRPRKWKRILSLASGHVKYRLGVWLENPP